MTNNRIQEHVARLAEGDRAAFEFLFRSYYGKVSAFVSLFVRSSADAEDMAQDIFVKLWEKHGMLKSVKSFDSWLFGMSRNAAIDYIRRHTADPMPVEMAYCCPSSSAEDDYLASEKELLIRLLVSSLPEKRRRIFEMSRYEGLSNTEIAERLSISRKTVENQISLVLAEIRQLADILILFGIFWLGGGK